MGELPVGGLLKHSREYALGYARNVAVYCGSKRLDRQGKHVAQPTFGLDDAWRTRINLKLASETKDLHVNAAIKHILMDPGRLQQVLTRQGALRRFHKCGQQSVHPSRQRDCSSAGIGQTARTAIKLPTAKSATTLLNLTLRSDAAYVLPTQHGPDPCEKLTHSEWFGHIVIGPKLQPDDTIDLVAPMARGDDHGHIGARPDLTQQIEAILLAKPKVEDHHVGLVGRELPGDILSLPSRDHPHVVLLKVIPEHALDGRIIVHDKNPR
jgi:hypothetical protein